MKIRLINKDDDWDALSNIYEESWKYAYNGIVPQEYLDSIPKGRWADILKKSLETYPQWRGLAMLEGDRIIGTSSYSNARLDSMDGYGEVISIYFLPEYIGKGYGKPLMQASVDGLAKMGYNKVYLWVLEDNKSARHFYEKFGFRPSGEVMVTKIGGKPLRELQYIYEIK